MEMHMEEKVEQKKGQILLFASAKGGVGKTVISVNIAVALATKGLTACIMDGSFQFGDVNLALDLQPKLTISDLVQDIKAVNSSSLTNYLLSHESGVKVLSAPLKPEYADLITSPSLQLITESLLNQYDYLIVDLAAGLSENNISFMELADKIFIVTDLEMAALKNTKNMLKTLEALGLTEKIQVVVNRADMESVIKYKDAAAVLEVEDLFYISNNFKIVSKSFNIGIPFVMNKPDEKISREISSMVYKICNRKYVTRRTKNKKTGLFSFFKRGR